MDVIGFVMAQAFIVIVLYFLSTMPESRKFQFLFLGLALTETILIPTFFYIIEDGGNIIPLLRINFWMLVILAWGLGLIAIYFKITDIVSGDQLETENEIKRFKRDF